MYDIVEKVYVEQFQLLLKYQPRPKFYIFLYPFSSAFFRSRKHLGFLPPFLSFSSSALWLEATKLPLCDLLTPFCGWKGGKKGVWAATAYSRKPAKKEEKRTKNPQKPFFLPPSRIRILFLLLLFLHERSPRDNFQECFGKLPSFFLGRTLLSLPPFLTWKMNGKRRGNFCIPPTHWAEEGRRGVRGGGKVMLRKCVKPPFSTLIPRAFHRKLSK